SMVATSSGSAAVSSARKRRAVQAKSPRFHRWRPSATYRCATSADGFSLKPADSNAGRARAADAVAGGLPGGATHDAGSRDAATSMYPKPVTGAAGTSPTVARPSVDAAHPADATTAAR